MQICQVLFRNVLVTTHFQLVMYCLKRDKSFFLSVTETLRTYSAFSSFALILTHFRERSHVHSGTFIFSQK